MLVMFVPNTTIQKIKLDFPCDRTNMILFSLHGRRASALASHLERSDINVP